MRDVVSWEEAMIRVHPSINKYRAFVELMKLVGMQNERLYECVIQKASF
jgi:hypothetical protein